MILTFNAESKKYLSQLALYHASIDQKIYKLKILRTFLKILK